MPEGSAQQPDRSEAAPAAGLWQRLDLRLLSEGEAGGLWSRLQERLEQAPPARPCLRQDLVLRPPQGEAGPFLLDDLREGRHFCLGKREAAILGLLDGRRTVDQIVSEYSARVAPISEQVVQVFVRDLQLAGLLEMGEHLWGSLARVRREPVLWMWTWPGAEEALPALYRRLRWLFTPPAGAGTVLLFLGVLVLLVRSGHLFREDLAYLSQVRRLVPFLLLAFYPVMLLVALTHEVAHALACIHFGGQVGRVGLMVRRFLPAAFADVSAVGFFPARARRAVFVAGPASTALWAALATALWAWTRPASFPHLLGAAVMLASFLSVWVNLNPVGGYDGSELLADLLGIPDLHRRALGYLWGRLRGRPVSVPPRERRLLGLYSGTFLWYHGVVVALIGTLLWHLFQG